MNLDLLVPYAVRGAARPRAGKRGAFTTIFMPKEHVEAEASLAWSLANAAAARKWPRALRGVCVSVEIDVVIARPKSETSKKWPDGRYPAGAKPDVDNVAKLVLDAGTKAGLWEDDTQVVDLRVRRYRAARTEGPSTRIAVAVVT